MSVLTPASGLAAYTGESAAPSVRGHFSNTASATSVALTVTSGCQTGDIGLISLTFELNGSDTPVTPSGWTLLGFTADSGTQGAIGASPNIVTYLYKKFLSPADSGATVTLSLWPPRASWLRSVSWSRVAMTSVSDPQ